MSILLALLGRRMVTFSKLRIHIHTDTGRSNSSSILFGDTTPSSTAVTIRLYLRHHESDIHFLGTLLHELGHCFIITNINGGHTDEWLETTAHLMMVVNHFIPELPLLDSGRHNLCAVAFGPNFCDKFTNGQVICN